MEEFDEIILKRPRREAITMLILQQNFHVQNKIQSYYKEAALNQKSVVYPDLVSTFLKLWQMIKHEYKAHSKKKYPKLNDYIKTIENEIQKNDRKHFDNVIKAYDAIHAFLLDTGVTAFVNTMDYDGRRPEQEDKAKGM